jgi:glycosyltransferase involved in cell wall biosynthesis
VLVSVNGRLKIAVVIASNDVGGAEKRFASLVQHLQKQGVDIHLVAKKCLCDKLRENSAYEDLKATHTIGFSRSCRRLLGSSVSKYLELLLMWCQLRYICMTGGYDVFHLVAGATSFIGAIRNAKKVVSIVNSVSLERVIKSNPGYSEALRGTSVVDFLSLDLRQRVYTAGIADNGRHFVSPCSFINQNVVQLTDKKDSSVVFVGRLIALKNPLLFLRAIPKVVRQCPDAIFYLLGDGPLRGRVECELAAHDLAEKVTAGFSCAPQEVLKNAAVFVSLQDKDNYPSQSLLEAMSAKCAIVATDVGQTRMLVDDAVGRLIQPGDVEGLSNAIIELLSDPSKTKSMGKEARSRVLSNHTIEKFSDYIENLYVRAMEGVQCPSVN